MIDGLVAKRISDPSAQGPLEIELTVTDPGQSALDGQSDQAPAYFTLSVILVIGPPDPNALSYLLPRRLFDRDAPIHVGALAFEPQGLDEPDEPDEPDGQMDLTEPILEILEVMAPGDRVVFLCQDVATLNEACLTLGLTPPEIGIE